MKKKIISIVLVVALIAGVVFTYNYFTEKEVEAAEFRNGFLIEPTMLDATGIEIDTQFELTLAETKEDYTESQLKEIIEFTEGEYSISKIEDKYIIKPFSKLEKNKIVQFTIKENKIETNFTFQTEDNLEIVSSLPADMSTNVPLNTGIEIYFNKEGVENIEDFFKIVPEVKGEFKVFKNTVVFVSNELKPATLYTVTVDKGISIKGSDNYTTEDYTFSFETALDEKTGNIYYEKGHVSFTREIYEFAESEDINIPIYYYINREYHDEKTYSLDTSIYSFKSAENFKEALVEKNKFPTWTQFSYQNTLIETNKLQKIYDKTIDIKTNPDSDKDRILSYDELPKGYYIIELTFDEKKIQAFIQVTNVGVFQIDSQEGMLFWIKDLSNDQNIEDAILTINDDEQYKSDSEGLIFTNLEISDSKEFGIIERQDESIILALYKNDVYYGNYSNEYWNYLFMDRTLYKPDDQVEFFGYIKNRYKDSESVNNVTVEISRGGYYPMFDYSMKSEQIYFPSLNEAIMKKEVNLEKNAYEGSFDLPNLSEGSYQIFVKYNDKVISNAYFTVEKYNKPDYKIEIRKDKEAIFLGDTVKFNINSQFYEGTSVSNLDFRYGIRNYFGGKNITGEAQTNENGEYIIDYTPTSYNESQGERMANLNVNSLNPEIGEIYANNSVTVFINDIYPEYKGEKNDSQIKLKANLFYVDLKNLNDNDPETTGYKGKEAPGVKVNGKLIKVTYDKIETGTYYDYVNKVSRKEYKYERKEETVDNFEFITNSKGIGTYTYNYIKDDDVHYYALVEFKDSDGRKVEDRVYFREVNENNIEYMYYNNSSRIELIGDESYSVGEEVNTAYYHLGETIEEGDFLYLTMQNGIRSYKKSNTGKYSFNFSNEDIPNIYIGVVYYTGKTFEYSTALVKYDYQEKKMTIDTSFDKDSYIPGDTVEMTLETKDDNEKPIEATVNLAVVDEAMFSMGEQYVNVLDSLYSNISAGVNYTYSSHSLKENTLFGAGRVYGGSDDAITEDSMEMDMDMNTAAYTKSEDGARQSTYVRSDFKDTAEFINVNTDENGLAIVSFKIPDNITSWRVTMQGISKDLEAGSNISNVNVSLPFFINYTLSDTFLVGDKPYLGITCYGNELKENEMIEISIDGFEKTYQIEAFKREYIELPEMNETNKDSSVIIYARTESGLEDAIEHKYKVIKSYHEVDITKKQKAQVGMELESGNDQMTTYRFVNATSGRYLTYLYSLAYIRGNRIEQRITTNKARELLNRHFETDYEINSVDYSEFQKADGGIAFLPYGNSDITTTISVLNDVKDKVDKKALIDYLYNIKFSDVNNETYVKALYGLSILGEPVLTDLKNLEEIDNQSLMERAYTALAYNALGETEVARRIYSEYILKELYITDDYARVESTNNYDEQVKETAVVSMLAYKIDATEKEILFNYIIKENTDKYLTIVEKMSCISEELVNSDIEEVAVVYEYLDKVYEKDITKYGTSITIPSQMSDELSINEINGDVDLIITYKGYEEIEENDKYISISREYENYSNPGEPIDTNDIVKVNLKIKIDNEAVDLNYGVTDYLPSGLRAIENSCRYLGISAREIHYYVNVDGQKVYFNVYGSRKENKEFNINYLARVINPGEYTSEKAILRGYNDKSSVAYSERDKIEIIK